MWALVLHDGRIYAGTVEGNLLVIDAETLHVLREIEAGKKNIRSVMIDGDRLLTPSQAKNLIIRDLSSIEAVATLRNVHKRMFHIAGCAGNKLYTVCHPYGELKIWDRTALELLDTLHFSPGISGHACIDGDRLYLSSRNVAGLLYLDLAT
jgi:hypothetical protein